MKSTLQVLPYIAVQLLKKSSNLRPQPAYVGSFMPAEA